MHGRFARALAPWIFVFAPPVYAHESKLAFLAEHLHQANPPCESELGRPPLYVPDAKAILKEPNLLDRHEGARLILAGWVLEELGEAAADEHLDDAVKVFRASLMRELAKPEAERRVRIDSTSYVKELSDTGLDRTRSSTKLLALARHYADEAPTILSEDVFLVAKAQYLNIKAEVHHVTNPLTDPNARDMFPFKISNEDMRAFERDGVLPVPEGLDIQPNQFVQFSSDDTPSGKNTVGRYIYERPKLITEGVKVEGDRLIVPTSEIAAEFAGTLRVKVNGSVVPAADGNPKLDGGWIYDGQGVITFVGKRYLPAPDANVEVFVQRARHRIQALQSFKQMGVKGNPASFEGLMLMNLLTDLSIDAVIVLGVAGGTKSYSAATAALWAQEKFKKLKVMVTRVPAHVGSRDPGAVPGGLKEKEAVWIMGMLRTIGQILKKEVRELPPNWENPSFAYLRGLSLNDVWVIFDEAQNTTKDLMKTMITRIGRNSRILILGDVTQTDGNENLRLSVSQNGLAAAVALYRMPILTAEEKSRVAVIHMRKSVRSELAAITARIFEQTGASAP